MWFKESFRSPPYFNVKENLITQSRKVLILFAFLSGKNLKYGNYPIVNDTVYISVNIAMNAKLQGGRNDRTREICFIIGYCTYAKLKQLEGEKCNEC